MTEFKKTLQQGTPDQSAPAAPRGPIAPAGVVSPHNAPIAPSGVVSAGHPSSSARGGRAMMPSAPVLVGGGPPPMRAPSSSSPGVPPSSEGPPSSGAYVPPPAGPDELRRSRPPQGHRTPSATRSAPDFGPPLPENAPGWMLRARRMSLALEEAIRAGEPTPALEACIERAWASWELDGSQDKQIARIARLIDKAHTAIRETPAAKLETAYNECAQVLWAGLPRHVKSKQEFAQVLLIIRDLRAEADSWAAVVDATAKLLGWSQAARAHAAHAVRVAILSER
ncbi:MAG TPA: hypothetical protein VHE30_13120 [Polyangiaceae bacterium]|nr:hypothetical protein [Polyangiaceae bacterium]